MRWRAVAAILLQLLQLLHAARIDSGDFNSVLGQITKGNRLEQCPCVRPPEGGACISYDSRFQASHVEEAMISFVDLSLPDRERPTDADSLACVSPECRACFSMLFYRIQEIGLLPPSYRPSIPVVPKSSLSPSLCPRLRFPTATDYSGAAASALAAVPPSAAIAGLIERGHRFARAAEAAQAASEAISKLKDEQAKNEHHHGRRGRKKQNRNHNSHHAPQSSNNNNNNNNNNQVQVTPAQNQGQGRTATPQPSRQFTVQQQLRVQQPSLQQQQQIAQQAQQARWQQQQVQLQQQQQLQFQQQQQLQQQQQFNTQQQFPQQQFPQQQQFPNQFNPQQQFSNAQQFIQTARQLNSIADTITGIHEGIHAARLLHRWRPPGPGPRPPPGPGPSPGPGPGPGPGPNPGHGHGSGSSESNEDDGYHDPHHHHHHHHHQQQWLEQLQQPQQMIPEVPQGPQGPQGPLGPQGLSPPQPPPFLGNNAGIQAGAGPQAGFPPFPGGGFPGGGGQAGGGFGGGGGGGRWPFRRIRSSPLERRRRAILASQTGAKYPVEMEVVSPLISPLVPKELRPAPVEVSFSHDAEHIFSEERSAFAELVRDKRQNNQKDDDGVLGSRFTIACFDRGETENGGDDKMLSLCGGCWVWRRLPEGFFPPIVNELVCKKEDRCLSGWGRCVDKTRSVNVLRKVKGQWTAAALSTGTCCDCKIVAGSEIHSLIVG